MFEFMQGVDSGRDDDFFNGNTSDEEKKTPDVSPVQLFGNEKNRMMEKARQDDELYKNAMFSAASHQEPETPLAALDQFKMMTSRDNIKASNFNQARADKSELQEKFEYQTNLNDDHHTVSSESGNLNTDRENYPSNIYSNQVRAEKQALRENDDLPKPESLNVSRDDRRKVQEEQVFPSEILQRSNNDMFIRKGVIAPAQELPYQRKEITTQKQEIPPQRKEVKAQKQELPPPRREDVKQKHDLPPPRNDAFVSTEAIRAVNCTDYRHNIYEYIESLKVEKRNFEENLARKESELAETKACLAQIREDLKNQRNVNESMRAKLVDSESEQQTLASRLDVAESLYSTLFQQATRLNNQLSKYNELHKLFEDYREEIEMKLTKQEKINSEKDRIARNGIQDLRDRYDGERLAREEAENQFADASEKQEAIVQQSVEDKRALEKELAMVNSKMEENASEMEKLKADKESVETELTFARQEVTKLSADFDGAVKILESQKVAHDKEIEEATKAFSKLEVEKAELETKAQETSTALESQIISLKEKLQESEQSLATLKTTHAATKEDLERAQLEVVDLRNQIDGLEKSFEHSNNVFSVKMEELEKANELLKEEKVDLNSTVVAKETEAETLKSEVKRLQEDMDSLSLQKTSASVKNSELDSELNHLREAIQVLEEKLESTKDYLNVTIDERDKTKEEKGSLEDDLQRTSKEVFDLKAEIQQKQEERDTLDAQLAQLKKKYKEVEEIAKRAEDIENQLRITKDELRNKKRENSKIEDLLEQTQRDLRSKSAAQDASAGVLKKDLIDKDRQINEYKKEVAKLTKELLELRAELHKVRSPIISPNKMVTPMKHATPGMMPSQRVFADYDDETENDYPPQAPTVSRAKKIAVKEERTAKRKSVKEPNEPKRSKVNKIEDSLESFYQKQKSVAKTNPLPLGKPVAHSTALKPKASGGGDSRLDHFSFSDPKVEKKNNIFNKPAQKKTYARKQPTKPVSPASDGMGWFD